MVEMKNVFFDILISRGLSTSVAREAAENFTNSSIDGVYSHGVNRFPRIVQYLDKGLISTSTEPECLGRVGNYERWDGHLGMGNVIAKRAMDRACAIAKESGIGLVAVQNTNHWLRGGAYGWQAAAQGCIGICWTNTMPNTAVWGGIEPLIGNNPFIIAVPQQDGKHVVIDCAMSQFAFGKVEMARMKGEQLQVPGGWDTKGNITTDPAEIEKSNRMLTIGYWKGSGLSIVLDMVAAILSGGNTVTDIARKYTDEIGLSQIFIAINPYAIGNIEYANDVISTVVNSIKSATPMAENGKIYYPGEIELMTRIENMRDGIPVLDEIWQSVCALRQLQQ
ncbi:MAG: 3-dehydro-L-gulonate 2-dehydrogenase [Christensenella sp.]